MRIYTHDFVYLGVSTVYSTVGRNFWPHYCIAIISGCCKRKVNVLAAAVLLLPNLFGLDSLRANATATIALFYDTLSYLGFIGDYKTLGKTLFFLEQRKGRFNLIITQLLALFRYTWLHG